MKKQTKAKVKSIQVRVTFKPEEMVKIESAASELGIKPRIYLKIVAIKSLANKI